MFPVDCLREMHGMVRDHCIVGNIDSFADQAFGQTSVDP